DPWLERWLPLVRERAGGSPVLELGCGPGEDTATLSHAGLRVIAIDRSTESIAKARALLPGMEYHCQDMRAPFPPSAAGLGVVLASLSLHYFAWSETVTLVERIHDVLRIGGVLLCRLNSTEDHHHGASGHPAIETNYYLVEGEPKRFFDRASIDRLFAKGWRVIDIGHHVVDRYAPPKALWEVILEKTAQLVVLAALLIGTEIVAVNEASAQSPALLLETRCEVWDAARRCVLWGPSLVELITRPEIYDGRRVQVIGWMNLVPED